MTSLWNGLGQIVRTDGTRTGDDVWEQARAANQDVAAAAHDAHDQGLADSIEKCLNRDGENTPTANISWGSFKLTSLGDGTAAADSANVEQVQDGRHVWGGTSGGTSNDYTITLTPAPTLVTGLKIRWIADKSNSGAVTLTVNGTQDALRTISGAALMGREVRTGELNEAVFDGTNWRLLGPVVSERTTAFPSANSVSVTDLRTDARRITIMIDALSTTGTEDIWLRLGPSGGLVTSGYEGTSSSITASAIASQANSSAFIIVSPTTAAGSHKGRLVLTKENDTDDAWHVEGSISRGTPQTTLVSGRLELGGPLTQLRILTASSDTFDAGSFTLVVE